MPYDIDIGDGADALGQNQLTDALDGTYWVSGWDATLGTGDLEVDIAAGDGAVDGTNVSTASTQTIDFTGDPDSTDPRKAVIYVDSGGTVQKTLGTPAPVDPSGEIRFRTYNPSPPASVSGVVVAEVWLAAGVAVLESVDVRDRRVSNSAVESISVSIGPTTVESLLSAPISRIEHGAVFADGYVYLFGGEDGSGSKSDTAVRYSEANDTWETITPLPAALDGLGAAEVDDVPYAVAGDDSGDVVDTLYEYDAGSDSWATNTALPNPRVFAGVTASSDSIYVAAGFDSSFNATDTIYEYDVSADSWTLVNNLPTALTRPTAAFLDGSVYVIGGPDGSNTIQDAVYEYDISADTVTTVAALPTATSFHSATTFKGNVYALGGRTGSGETATVYRYDDSSDSWSGRISLPSAREGLASTSSDTVLYSLAGFDGTNVTNDTFVRFRNLVR